MRILHLLSQTELTGAEVYAQNLILAQHQEQHQVHVISDNIHVALPIQWQSLSLSTASFWQRMQNILKLRRFIIAHQIQVIHCHSRGAVRHAYWARLGLKTAMVTTLHGRQHSSFSKKIMNIYGEICIAICENVKKQMVQSFSMPASAIRISRNPCAIATSPSANNPGTTNPQTNIKTKHPSIALLGRSSGPKGERIEQIAQTCFRQWLKQHPLLKIAIIAPRPERFSTAFHKLCSELNNEKPGCIEILGQIPNLTEQLPKFHLNICSGRIAIESLLSHTPVLAVGEDRTIGIVNKQNWPEALASNFGDISESKENTFHDLNLIKEQALDFLSKPQTDAEVFNQCELEFNPAKIQKNMIETYKAAIFKRHVPQWIPVLMYHKIPQAEIQSQHRIFVTTKNFEKHLQFFAKNNFTSMTFTELAQYWNLEKDFHLFPKKPLLLTFDDGYLDNLENAQPLLLKYKMKACLFLLADHSINQNSWDLKDHNEPPAQLMNLNQKKQIDPHCFEIGSHGFSHPHLTELTSSEAYHEMLSSRLQLERDLSTRVVAFAYPFGSRNDALAEICQQAGYQFAVNTDQGGLHLADDPFSIFRVNIFPEENLLGLWKKTSPWYRRRFYRKKKR